MFCWIATNEKLESLEWVIELQSVELVVGLFVTLENHKGLRLLCIDRYQPRDPGQSLLTRLLARNKNIEMFTTMKESDDDTDG